MNIISIKFISLGVVARELEEKPFQNCFYIENSQKIEIFDYLIINSIGRSQPIGIIMVNDKNFLKSYVLFFFFDFYQYFYIFRF